MYKIKLIKQLPLKWIYLTSAMIVILITLVLYRTYAMYNVNTNSGSSYNSQFVKTYNFDINSNQNFTVAANSIYSFNVLVKNTTNGNAYFEIYYSTDDLANVVVAEVVNDTSLTPSALNTSFTLESSASKVVPLVILNNSSNEVNVSINIAKGFGGNSLSYNGTKVSQTYNISDITNKCDSQTDMNDCIGNIKDGEGIALYCLMY